MDNSHQRGTQSSSQPWSGSGRGEKVERQNESQWSAKRERGGLKPPTANSKSRPHRTEAINKPINNWNSNGLWDGFLGSKQKGAGEINGVYLGLWMKQNHNGQMQSSDEALVLAKEFGIPSFGELWKDLQPQEYSSTAKSHNAGQSVSAESPFWTGTNNSPEVEQLDHTPTITYENRESSENSVANDPDSSHQVQENPQISHSNDRGSARRMSHEVHSAENVLLDERDSERNSSQILQQHRNGSGSNGIRVGSPALSELNTRNMGAQFHAPSHNLLIPQNDCVRRGTPEPRAIRIPRQEMRVERPHNDDYHPPPAIVSGRRDMPLPGLEILAMALGNVGFDMMRVSGVDFFRRVNSGAYSYSMEPDISASALGPILLTGMVFFDWMIFYSIVGMFMNERWRERRLKWLLWGIVSGLLVAVLLARYTSHIIISILPLSVILNLFIAEKYDSSRSSP